MNEQEKNDYLENYHKAKEDGEPFYPDVIFKDAVVAFLVFILLLSLAYFVGAPLEARANPADTNYTPRPEWYFLFLFQLLKYFPGNLEVLGVVLLPTVAILLLFLLPVLDRTSKRNFRSRSWVVGGTAVIVAGILLLTVQAYRETPPPVQASQGDPTAALYAKNCAGCHGSTITVGKDANLHDVIAGGRHQGMPAWSGDLTSDQIDELAGFILSPTGSDVFVKNCSSCHDAQQLIASNPVELNNALEQGSQYPAHQNVANIPDWKQTLKPEDITALVNYLDAPDGKRLFEINCSPCHGYAVGFSGDEAQLKSIISQGGLHLEMPPWESKLTADQISLLARYIVNPQSQPDGAALFQDNCSKCHGDRIPTTADVTSATAAINSGGAHQTMPVWGNVLTPAQLDALVSYTMETSKGSPLEVGQKLFSTDCAPCHGDFGEGGANPARKGDTIAPISTSEFLKTRDDYTLENIIARGQPNFGMSPFGSSFGGPLDTEDINAIVAYIRSWEKNPPVELPPEVAQADVSLSGEEIYANLCAQCHGPNGEGGVGPALNTQEFKDQNTDQKISDTINEGHKATPMISWGEILNSDQIDQIVKVIRQFKTAEPTQSSQPTEPSQPTPTAGAVSFKQDVLPIFKDKCNACHGSVTLGGWDASSYKTVMTSGDHAPVIVPADPDGSLLVQKLRGEQTSGTIMPPGSKLSPKDIQLIINWILAGAPEN